MNSKTENLQKQIIVTYEVSNEVHCTLVDFFCRLTDSLAALIFSGNYNGVIYTQKEKDEKVALLFAFADKLRQTEIPKLSNNQPLKLQYNVSITIHRNLVDFMNHLTMDTAFMVLGQSYEGVRFTEQEIEIKTDLLFQFFYNQVNFKNELLLRESEKNNG